MYFNLTYKKITGCILIILMVATSVFSTSVFAQSADEAQLRRELEQLQVEIAQKEKELSEQKKNSASIGSDLTKLKSQIDKAKLEISLKQKMITQLGGQITQKVKKIGELDDKRQRGEMTLAQILRKKFQIEETTVPELLLTNTSVSDYYSDRDIFDNFNASLQDSFQTIKRVKAATDEEKKSLEQKQDAELDVKYELEKSKKQVEVKQTEKNNLLSISKSKEKSYEQVIAERKARADKIRSELFRFAGGSTKAIPFGTALEYAKEAEKKTGTPAAFVLAILTQESALGANVGRCYINPANDGTGVNTAGTKTYTNSMSPKRDIPPFLEITRNLGMDPYKTVVSCPIAGVAGWGGAMGPAQFIPSTWKLFINRITAITGSANPWDAEDAIVASSLYLSDLGASTGYAGQIRAACKYYGTGGSNCSYGKQVLGRVAKIQANIDILEGN